MIEIKVALTQKDKLNFCNLALKSQLFVPGWQLQKDLSSISDSNLDEIQVSLAFINQKPVGIAFRKLKKIQCFVLPVKRKNGIGSLLLNHIDCSNAYAFYGLDGSDAFWTSNKILCLQA